MNMLRMAPPEDQAAVEAQLRSLSARELTRLAQVFTVALRECSPMDYDCRKKLGGHVVGRMIRVDRSSWREKTL